MKPTVTRLVAGGSTLHSAAVWLRSLGADAQLCSMSERATISRCKASNVLAATRETMRGSIAHFCRWNATQLCSARPVPHNQVRRADEWQKGGRSDKLHR